jgi:hypothetical protein
VFAIFSWVNAFAPKRFWEGGRRWPIIFVIAWIAVGAALVAWRVHVLEDRCRRNGGPYCASVDLPQEQPPAKTKRRNQPAVAERFFIPRGRMD